MSQIDIESYRSLNSRELQSGLIGVTVGGSENSVDLELRARLFAVYVERAFPTATVLEVRVTNTAAALNSVSGVVTLRWESGEEQTVFGKVHIESHTGRVDPLGAEKEYANAQMLVAAGWPALRAIVAGVVADYPLLLYPVVREQALFDALEKSHLTGEVTMLRKDIDNMGQYNVLVGEREVSSMRMISRDEAVGAPVQNLFLKRVEKGGRLDQWYLDGTLFCLPGLERALPWAELLDVQWVINGILYEVSLKEILAKAKSSLAFSGERTAYAIISHGDDHAGNIRLTEPVLVFDPAFAGLNPASLELKAFAHTGFLPMAAMYYAPKGLDVRFAHRGNLIEVESNILELPTYALHEELARQIIDGRLLPLIREIRDRGGNIRKEKERIAAGLVTCALLTVNVASLLERKDGRGVGLLPIAILFSQLEGLPMLRYLNECVDKLL